MALVADRDEIIAVSGAPKKGLLGKKVSSGVQVALERGETVTFDDPPAIESFPSGGQVAAPVMQEGELAGSVLILARDGKLSDLEKRLAETAANFLAKPRYIAHDRKNADGIPLRHFCYKRNSQLRRKERLWFG